MDEIFWIDILKSVCSGLATGLILVIIGLIVWKYQHRYTKKFDVYIKSLANISQVKSLIENIRKPIRQDSIENIYQSNKDLFYHLERNKYEFAVYFGKDFEKDFDCFSSIMFQLRNYDNKFQHAILEALDDRKLTKETIYGSDNPNDEINTNMRLSFNRIQKALKRKH